MGQDVKDLSMSLFFWDRFGLNRLTPASDLPRPKDLRRRAMNLLITKLICTFNGYFYESAGVISGFFPHRRQATACATAIKTLVNNDVQICGSQLTITL